MRSICCWFLVLYLYTSAESRRICTSGWPSPLADHLWNSWSMLVITFNCLDCVLHIMSKRFATWCRFLNYHLNFCISQKYLLLIINKNSEKFCVVWILRNHRIFMPWLSIFISFFIVHTMEELKLTGNHLKGSRPILTFSTNFDKEPHWKLLKEIIMQVCLVFHSYYVWRLEL